MWCYQASTGEPRPVGAIEACCEGGYIGVELGAMWCYQASTGESRPVGAEACCEGGHI